MDIVFDGLEELFKKLDGVADEAKITALLGKAAAIVEADARKKAQVNRGTGELSRSITSKVEGNEGIIYTPLEYAPYVEYGTGIFAEEVGRTDVPWSYKDEKGEWHTTSGMHPHPYMRPALEENRGKILKIFKEGLLNG